MQLYLLAQPVEDSNRFLAQHVEVQATLLLETCHGAEFVAVHGPCSGEHLESKYVFHLTVLCLELCQSSNLRKELVQLFHFALSFTNRGNF